MKTLIIELWVTGELNGIFKRLIMINEKIEICDNFHYLFTNDFFNIESIIKHLKECKTCKKSFDKFNNYNYIDLLNLVKEIKKI